MSISDPHTRHDLEVAPQLEEFHLSDRPDGPGAAAMLAAGIGVFVLGLLTTVNEMSEAVHEFLAWWEWGRGVGPLAGKTTLAVAFWLISWGGLATAWRRRDVDLRRTFMIALILGLLGVLLTFPPIFTLFAAE